MSSRPKRSAARKDWSWLSSSKSGDLLDDDASDHAKPSPKSSTTVRSSRGGRPSQSEDVGVTSVQQQPAVDEESGTKRQRKRKTYDDEFEMPHSKHRERHAKSSSGSKKHANKKSKATFNDDADDDDDVVDMEAGDDDTDDTFGDVSDTSGAGVKHRKKSHHHHHKKAKDEGNNNKHRYESDEEYRDESKKTMRHVQLQSSLNQPQATETPSPKLTIKLPLIPSSSATNSGVPTPAATTTSSSVLNLIADLHAASSTAEAAAQKKTAEAGSNTKRKSTSGKTADASLSPNKISSNSSKRAAAANVWACSTGGADDDDDDDDADDGDILDQNGFYHTNGDDDDDDDVDSEEEWLKVVDEGDWEKLEQLQKVSSKNLTARQRAVVLAASSSTALHDADTNDDDEATLDANQSLVSLGGGSEHATTIHAALTSGTTISGTGRPAKSAEKRAADLKKRRDQAVRDREKQKTSILSRLVASESKTKLAAAAAAATTTTSASDKVAAAAVSGVAMHVSTTVNKVPGEGGELPVLTEKLPVGVQPWQLSSYEYVSSNMRGNIKSFYKIPIGAPPPFSTWTRIEPHAKAVVLCGVCQTSPRKYQCPKTDTPYCSVKCYKQISVEVGLARDSNMSSAQVVKA